MVSKEISGIWRGFDFSECHSPVSVKNSESKLVTFIRQETLKPNGCLGIRDTEQEKEPSLSFKQENTTPDQHTKICNDKMLRGDI
jgi:hypothetical protein